MTNTELSRIKWKKGVKWYFYALIPRYKIKPTLTKLIKKHPKVQYHYFGVGENMAIYVRRL